MKPHHAIIFDLDGTLVDSLQDITAALNAALKELHRAPADAST
ncbi:MAG TPA: HAD hydrolase-like protein, partial [Phycisphaerae bacterium]|nr:HAD hydrolase-like protein [Phycisphaerae bacterium]